MNSATLKRVQQLIRLRSVTPDNGGCQDLVARRLKSFGFAQESLRCGEFHKPWMRRGQAKPVVCFAGHTDVVPSGPLDQCLSGPFAPSLREGRRYGRDALKSIYQQVLERLLLPA